MTIKAQESKHGVVLLLAERDRLRAALAFYADPTNHEWRPITDDEAAKHDWSEEDRVYAHTTSVLLDDGERAREALS
jgi:predicted component of type VI protein secretion system